MKIAIYPGSFDPITLGHIDILKRAADCFDEVVVLLAVNSDKKSRFTIDERFEMVKEAVKDFKNIRVDKTSGLTVEYAKKHNAKYLIRGLREVTDFEYEFQLNTLNRHLDNSVETIFFMANPETSYISSSSVMELYKHGVDVSSMVPSSVLKYLK